MEAFGGSSELPNAVSGEVPRSSGGPPLDGLHSSLIPSTTPTTVQPSSSPSSLNMVVKNLTDLHAQVAAMAAIVQGLQNRDSRVSEVPTLISGHPSCMVQQPHASKVQMAPRTDLDQPPTADVHGVQEKTECFPKTLNQGTFGSTIIPELSGDVQ